MSIVEQAAAELKRINFGADDTTVMLDIMRRFFDQWDSGGAVSEVLPVLIKCIAGKPLSPLTGTDDEWIDRSDVSSSPTWQNVRCSSVFKDDTGKAWNIDAPDQRAAISFPYIPGEVPGLADLHARLMEHLARVARDDARGIIGPDVRLGVGDLAKLLRLIEDRANGLVPPPVMVMG